MTHITIPFVDLRGKTSVDLLRAYPDRARDVIRMARKSWGVWSELPSYAALPVADYLSRRWLVKQRNPYLYEIESIAGLLGGQGGYALNMCFEWGCTSGVWNTGDTASLMRVVDWPFPGIGKYALVALQSGKAGNFYNITWPGMVGVFSAMAPGRFSAAINQAPMREHGLMYGGDWLKNRALLAKQTHIPPEHLLRRVCETAKDFEEAKEMLRATPIAVPAIFTLAGVKKGEGCIIERLEEAAEVLPMGERTPAVSANHFISRLQHVGKGWRPREIDSAGRHKFAAALAANDLDAPHFAWLKPPAANANTRMCLLADAAESRLMVQGFEGVAPVTKIFQLGGAREVVVELPAAKNPQQPPERDIFFEAV